eukprot:PhM_4_TR9597/c0_g1_i1/m.42818
MGCGTSNLTSHKNNAYAVQDNDDDEAKHKQCTDDSPHPTTAVITPSLSPEDRDLLKRVVVASAPVDLRGVLRVPSSTTRGGGGGNSEPASPLSLVSERSPMSPLFKLLSTLSSDNNNNNPSSITHGSITHAPSTSITSKSSKTVSFCLSEGNDEVDADDVDTILLPTVDFVRWLDGEHPRVIHILGSAFDQTHPTGGARGILNSRRKPHRVPHRHRSNQNNTSSMSLSTKCSFWMERTVVERGPSFELDMVRSSSSLSSMSSGGSSSMSYLFPSSAMFEHRPRIRCEDEVSHGDVEFVW